MLETVLHLDRQEQLVGYRGCGTALGSGDETSVVCSPNGKPLTRDGLIIGALEAAYVEMVGF